MHLAMAAVMNAVWDLAARRAGKPLWRLLVDMTPEQLADAADLKYLSDVLTRDEAVGCSPSSRRPASSASSSSDRLTRNCLTCWSHFAVLDYSTAQITQISNFI